MTTPLTPTEQAALYDQIRANSTYVPGQGYIQNDRIQGDSRGSWIGAPTNAAPGTWVGAMSYLNGVPQDQLLAAAEAGPATPYTGQATPNGDPSQLASNIARAGAQTRPGITSTPYQGSHRPGQGLGAMGPAPSGVNPYLNPINPNARFDPTSAYRTAMGPGTMPPAFRPMPRVGMTPMPTRPMPAFPSEMRSPFNTSPDELWRQQSSMMPTLIQQLTASGANFGGNLPNLFAPPARLRTNTALGPGTLPGPDMGSYHGDYPERGDGP